MTPVSSLSMPRRLPAGCSEDTDRHGNHRIYYRVAGRAKVRLRNPPWTPEFMAEYAAAREHAPVAQRPEIKTGTWRWLCIEYFGKCTEYKLLDPQTQHVRRLILESTFDEPTKPGSNKFYRDMPLPLMDVDAIEVLRDRKLEFPEAANGRVKAIRQVFKFGIKKKYPNGKPYLTHNAARDVGKIKTGSTGFHTWTVDEVRQYEAHHPVGSKARLFLALLLFLGVRRSDAIRFGKQHVRKATLTFTQHKGRKRQPKRLTLPVLPALQAVLDASPCGDLTFLVNDLGRPFTDAGIGNKMREWCDDAGLPHCTAHGVRKAGATIAAENGATAHMLMAIFGWKTIQQAEVYTRAADQVRLARSSMHMIEADAKAQNESGS